MSVVARMRVLAAVVQTSVLVILGAALVDGADLGPGVVVAAFVVLQALSWGSSYWLQPKGETEVWQLDEGIFATAALVLPPAGVLLVFIVGTPIGCLVARSKPRYAAFNSGQMGLAAGAGLAVAHLINPATELSLLGVVAVLAGTAVLALVNELLVAVFFWLSEGRCLLGELAANVRFRAVRSPSVASVGVVAGIAGSATNWGPLFAVPPLAAVQYLLAEHLRAERDRERAHGLFDAATEAHASVRTEEVQRAVTQAAARLLRCESAAVVARPPVHGEWGARLTLATGEERWLTVKDRHSDESMDDEDLRLLDAIAAIGASALDNAELVDQVKHRALHDPLTGLPNQLLFDDRVSQAITTAEQSRAGFAVVVLDLDAFRKVNDSLGHSAGDELLRMVADRLSHAVGPLDTVARLGSDHFTLLLTGVSRAQAAGVRVGRLLSALRRPVVVGDHELFMTASAGIAFYPADGQRPEHLLRNADSAMHRAKSLGRDNYQIYAAGMNERAHLRLVREGELQYALQRQELRVHYQPQIDLQSGWICGVEALVRWEHPVLGLIGPAEFVPLAEESGLIINVDTWVLEQACRQAQGWAREGVRPLRIAVNLSGRHFQDSDRMVAAIKDVLRRTAIDPRLLEVEVTEGVAVGETEETAQMLQDVRELGVRVAIDDFGTGYSMLSRLQQFPIDCLKIDSSFVREITTAHGEAPIVAAVISLARSMHMEVVAEGVETLEQQTFLRFHGCDQAQGFLYSRPVEAAEISRLLRTRSLGFNVAAVPGEDAHVRPAASRGEEGGPEADHRADDQEAGTGAADTDLLGEYPAR